MINIGIDLKTLEKIVRMPLTLLIGLTCVGIIINFFNLPILIAVWWTGVLLFSALASAWSGYQAVKKYRLNLRKAGIAGAVIWLIPGTIGLTIAGITTFINALLWEAIEGYEVVAFLGGAVVIMILIVVGAAIAFVLGTIGGKIAQRKS